MIIACTSMALHGWFSHTKITAAEDGTRAVVFSFSCCDVFTIALPFHLSLADQRPASWPGLGVGCRQADHEASSEIHT